MQPDANLDNDAKSHCRSWIKGTKRISLWIWLIEPDSLVLLRYRCRAYLNPSIS